VHPEQASPIRARDQQLGTWCCQPHGKTLLSTGAEPGTRVERVHKRCSFTVGLQTIVVVIVVAEGGNLALSNQELKVRSVHSGAGLQPLRARNQTGSLEHGAADHMRRRYRVKRTQGQKRALRSRFTASSSAESNWQLGTWCCRPHEKTL